MKIGIILYSYTGNTLMVGERLLEAMHKKGHDISLEMIKALDEDLQNVKSIELTEIPDVSLYDEIILGAPVRAFSLNPIMKTYLEKLQDFNGKKVTCFVTEHFPKPWMGGNHAIKQIKRLVEDKKGIIAGSGVINWSSKNKEEQINDMITRLTR